MRVAAPPSSPAQSMSVPDDSRMLGDYRLLELMHETPLIYQWVAVQDSVGRKVLVDELKQEAAEQRGKFLADVRAKAAIEHPLIASVFEAVDDEECFFAHENLPGASLELRMEAGEPMKPLEMSLLLRRIADIQLLFEKQGKSTAPMNLEHLHLDSHGVLRVANLVQDGKRTEHESARDMTYLGRALLPLVADGKEGTTRMLTLLAWMRGETDEGDDEALSWTQVVELCERIERQLTGEPTIRMIEAPVQQVESKSRPMGLMVATAILGLAVVILLARNFTSKGEDYTLRVELPEPVSIAATDGAGPDQPAVRAFRISAHEVTIDEYDQFLDTLDALERAGNSAAAFDHPAQPAEKKDHRPEDWENLLAAARKGGEWNGQRVNLDTPVVGVDWWDAMAYCSWKKGRLPTESEWRAALGLDADQVSRIPAAAWGRVDPDTEDRSPRGVLNMAGSVSEWTRLQTADPVNPLGAKKWLILGGSFKQEAGHALSREWIDDRGLRRDDLGFRVVFEAGGD